MPRAQGLGAPGCGACLCAWDGLDAVGAGVLLLLAEGRDISTTAAVTATSTTPMMTKGSGLFDFAGALLGLRLIRVATVREIFYGRAGAASERRHGNIYARASRNPLRGRAHTLRKTGHLC